MGEKMARERVEGEITPKEWVESQVLRMAEVYRETIDYWKGLPRKTKLKLATSFVVPATLGIATAVGAWRFYEGRVELPAIQPDEGKETTLEISAAQRPPEIGVSQEAKGAPDYFERIGPRWEEFKPPAEIEMVEGEKITYWVQTGDTLEYISAIYETPAAQIIKENNLTGEAFEQGQELIITTDIIHIVQPGETFEGLAEKYGVSVPLLAATNGIFYTENFDFIKPGYQMTIPRSEEELTLRDMVSIRASDEWDKETQEMINKMGEEIVYLLDRMRVFNGVEIIDEGEILVHPIPSEWEKEFKERGWRGLWKSREAGERENIPWGIYVWRDEVLSGENHAMAAIAHEFGHDCNEAHVVAYVAGFRISQYQSWIREQNPWGK